MATPKKNTEFKFSITLVDSAARPQFRANPTLAAGDVQVKTDTGGAVANIATLPTAHAARYDVDVTLSAGEMNGAEGTWVVFHDAAGAEWDDLALWIEYDVRNTDDLLPTASYTAPDNADIVAIKGKTDQLTFTEANKVDALVESETMVLP